MAGEDSDDPRIYVRIAAQLRQRMGSGDLAAGDRVPSITTLTQEWGVARETAAHALRVLEEDGLIQRFPGKGYYVKRRTSR